MTTHAKGPWSQDKFGNLLDADGRQVLVTGVSMPCGNHPDRATAEANTRLIAAAPELLTALKRIAEFEGEPLTPVRTAAKMKAIARAAIAKAEGKP